MKIEPLARKYRTFFVGVFVAVPVLAIPALLAYTFMKSDLWQGMVNLYVIYDNSYGLQRGGQVTISGTRVGHIQELELRPDRNVIVRFTVREQYLPLIKKDTKAQLKQKSFVVGDWEIELAGGHQDSATAKDGDTLQSVYPLQMDKTLEQVTGMVSAVEQILQLILSGEGTVGRLLTEDSLYRQMGSIAYSAEKLTEEAGRTMASADALIHSVQTTAEGGAEFIDSLGPLISSVRGTLEEAHSIVENIKEVSEDVPAIVGRIEDNLAEVEQMMRGLQKNWLLRNFMGKKQDPLLIDNP